MSRRLIFTGIALAVGFATAADAQTPTRIGTFRDWSAYSFADATGKICYAATQPSQSLPTGVNRDPVFLMVSTRPSERIVNETSIMIGYPIQENSTVTAEIDGQTFTLFTKDDGAWVDNTTVEAELVAAMKRGRTLVVKGTSRRGTNTTDTFSLQGVTAALDTVARECPGPA